MNHKGHSWEDRPDLQPRVAYPEKGERYRWQGLTYVITRVSSTGDWADIRVFGAGGWTKRQPLPLPAGSVLLPEESS